MDHSNQLRQIANNLVLKGKGILAADESNPTCKKRFESIYDFFNVALVYSLVIKLKGFVYEKILQSVNSGDYECVYLL